MTYRSASVRALFARQIHMSEAGRQSHHESGPFTPGPAAGHVFIPETFERLAEFVSPKTHISTRYAILYPLSTRRYGVQEDAIVFASGLDEANVVRWLIERVGITNGRGGRRYVVVLDLHRRIAWRAPYAEASEFLHTVNPG